MKFCANRQGPIVDTKYDEFLVVLNFSLEQSGLAVLSAIFPSSNEDHNPVDSS
jgi:hypothetical protein